MKDSRPGPATTAERPLPFPGIYPGTIQGFPDVPRLIDRAEVVCLGEVVGVERGEGVTYLVRGEPLRLARDVATLRTRRVYKGVAGWNPIFVEFLRPELPSSLTQLHTQELVILFLAAERPPRYGLVDYSSSKLTIEAPRLHPRERTEAIRAIRNAAVSTEKNSRIARAMVSDVDAGA